MVLHILQAAEVSEDSSSEAVETDEDSAEEASEDDSCMSHMPAPSLYLESP